MYRKGQNGRRTWATNEVEELIAKYKENPCLWDKSKDVNRSERETAIESIAAHFSTTRAEIMRKVHNLRSQHAYEYQRLKDPDAASGTKWLYFDAMDFLRENFDTRRQLRTADKRPTEIRIPTAVIGSVGSMKPSSETPSQHHEANDSRVIEPQKKKARVEVVQAMCDPREFEVFAQYVTSELRQLPKSLQFKLKRRIQMAILEVQEEHYEMLSDETIATSQCEHSSSTDCEETSSARYRLFGDESVDSSVSAQKEAQSTNESLSASQLKTELADFTIFSG